jgi:hypothetical protein
MFIEPGIGLLEGQLDLVAQRAGRLLPQPRAEPVFRQEGDATFPDYILLTGVSYRF